MPTPRETPWDADYDAPREEPAEVHYRKRVDPRKSYVYLAIKLLVVSVVVCACVNMKTLFRDETIDVDEDFPGFATTYVGARVDAFGMCYTIGRNETCHSYTKPSEFVSINKTDGTVSRVMLTGCQLLDDGRNMYGTQIPFNGGFAKFLRRFCDSGAPTWAPWVHIMAVVAPALSIVALAGTCCVQFGSRYATPLAWTATAATCLSAAVHLEMLVGWALGLGFNAMSLSGCSYLMAIPVLCSTLAALEAWHAVHPAVPALDDARNESAMEPLE